MITWRKLMGSAQFLVPNLIVAAIRCCTYEMQIDSITPDTGNQGTDVAVTMTGSFNDGCNGTPRIVIDGVYNGGSSGVSTNFDANVDPWTYASIPFTLHIDPNARLGVHSITIQTTGGAVAHPVAPGITVTCAGCPPPPKLLSVSNQSGLPLIPGGPAVTFRFVGTNFLNHNPQVQIDGPGISFPPGPYNVQGSGGYDYFFLPITADANAYTGIHIVRVTTDGGTSNSDEVEVTAYQPPPSPTPGSSPVLSRITPTHISRDPFVPLAPVYIKFEGSGFTGFGIYREVVVDNYPYLANTGPTYQANPDTVAVAVISTNVPDTSLTVRVHNLTNDTFSNGLILFLDELVPNAPVVSDLGGGNLNRGGDLDLFIGGQNLQGVTEQSFSGIPGLTFTNVHPDPNYPPDQGFWVHVHADASAPITGDEATNLIITTPNGQSNAFGLNVAP